MNARFPRVRSSLAGAAILLTAMDGWGVPRAVAPCAAQDQATFQSRVEAVRIDALVTEGGRPVRGLRATDFEVFDEGVRQQLTAATFERLPLNVTLALDSSLSVAGTRLEGLQAAGRTVLARLESKDRAALLVFADHLALASPPTSTFSAVRNALDQMQPGGGTCLFDAVHAGLVLGDSDAYRNLLIVFSDGTDTSSALAPADIIALARRTDVVVEAVVAGLAGRKCELHEIAAATGGSVVDVEVGTQLDVVFSRILEEFRQRYLLMYSPTGVSSSGWHRIAVRVKGRNVSVRARAGYDRR